jgi:hypothetical protein
LIALQESGKHLRQKIKPALLLNSVLLLKKRSKKQFKSALKLKQGILKKQLLSAQQSAVALVALVAVAVLCFSVLLVAVLDS